MGRKIKGKSSWRKAAEQAGEKFCPSCGLIQCVCDDMNGKDNHEPYDY